MKKQKIIVGFARQLHLLMNLTHPGSQRTNFQHHTSHQYLEPWFRADDNLARELRCSLEWCISEL
jgi:hypothetical protein